MALTKLNYTGQGTVPDASLPTIPISKIPTITGAKMPAGSAIQVKEHYRSRSSTTINLSTSFEAVLTTLVTPLDVNSTFCVRVDFCADILGDSHFDAQLRRDVSGGSETTIGDTGNAFNDCGNLGSANQHGIGYSMSFIDTPNTTSNIEYKFYARENSGGNIRLLVEAPMSMTVTEIKG